VDFSKNDSLVEETIYKYQKKIKRCKLCPTCIEKSNRTSQIVAKNNLTKYYHIIYHQNANPNLVKLMASFIYFGVSKSWLFSTGELNNLETLNIETKERVFDTLQKACDQILSGVTDKFDPFSPQILKEIAETKYPEIGELCKKHNINIEFFLKIRDNIKLI
jgi:hypothetical protein